MPRIEQSRIEPDITLLKIAGRITLGRECQEVEWVVEELIASGRTKVVMDLSQLNYIDSTGLGILVMCCGKIARAGGGARLVAMHPNVAELMRITRLVEILDCQPTVDAAVARFAPPMAT